MCTQSGPSRQPLVRPPAAQHLQYVPLCNRRMVVCIPCMHPLRYADDAGMQCCIGAARDLCAHRTLIQRAASPGRRGGGTSGAARGRERGEARPPARRLARQASTRQAAADSVATRSRESKAHAHLARAWRAPALASGAGATPRPLSPSFVAARHPVPPRPPRQLASS